MLIISQDRRHLMDVNGLDIYIFSKEIRASRWVDHYEIIGEYSSVEKAIKVLDMIQELFSNVYSDGNTFLYNYPKVFQMPEDSEV